MQSTTATQRVETVQTYKFGGAHGNQFVPSELRHSARCSCGWISTAAFQLTENGERKAEADGRRHNREAHS